MFVLGFIALMALVLFIQIAVFTWITPEWTVANIVSDVRSWILYFVMLVLGSLGAIGLDIWDDSRK